ncbi:MAG: dienelactone hydrolase family protein [Sphingomonadales bacterium]|nr:dienelactone hydrolase family protein [Sphingomonadales bacterium]
MRWQALIGLAAALALPAAAGAQANFPADFVKRIAPLPDRGAIALPVAAPAPAAPESEIWDLFGPGNPVVRNVTRPTLTPVLPDRRHATGAAVIVAPGGGYFMLSMQTEGMAIAQALAARGIAAFVLKYRLEATPPAEAEFLPAMMKRFAQAPHDAAATARMGHPDATADALAALRMIRARAGAWRVDPQRVGIIGFSAGAMTALDLARSAPAGEGPAFLGYVYGPQTIDAAPAGAPPLFDALAIDDPLFGGTSCFPIIGAWHAAKAPVELHVYGSGGHGFGAGKPGQTHAMLVEEFAAWLGMNHFLVPSPATGVGARQ